MYGRDTKSVQVVLNELLIVITIFYNVNTAPQFGYEHLPGQHILNHIKTNIHVNGGPNLNIANSVRQNFENFTDNALHHTLELLNRTIHKVGHLGNSVIRHTTPKQIYTTPPSKYTKFGFTTSNPTTFYVKPTSTTFSNKNSLPTITTTTNKYPSGTKVTNDYGISHYLNDSAPTMEKSSRQLLQPLPGYIPVYIRPGNTPLEDINLDLAEAFESYALKQSRLNADRSLGLSHNVLTDDDAKDVNDISYVNVHGSNQEIPSNTRIFVHVQPTNIQKIPKH